MGTSTNQSSHENYKYYIIAYLGIEILIDQVYELESLLIHLDALSSYNNSLPSISSYQASDLLRTSAYDYETGTCCGWHESQEIKFCSLGTVKIYRSAQKNFFLL